MDRKQILFLIEKVLSGSSSKEDEDLVNGILCNSFISEDWNEEEFGNEKCVRNRIADMVSEAIRQEKKLLDRKKFREIAASIKDKKLQSH